MTKARIATVIVLAALGLRVAAATVWQQQATKSSMVFRLGDSHSYWTLAEQIAHGRPYQYGSPDASIFRAPLFPLFLSPFTLIQGATLNGSGPEVGGLENTPDPRAVFAARLGCCLLGTSAVALLMLLATRVGGDCAGLACGALAAIHPGAIGMSIVILSEALFLPLMVLHLWFWLRAWESADRRTVRYSCWAGVCAGLAILARPSWLLFLPFLLGLGCLFGRNRRRHLVIGIVSLLTLSLTMSPWWIRNALLTGRFVPTSLQVGLSLYDGWHSGATGASDEGMVFSQAIQRAQRQADLENSGPTASTFEYRVDQRAKSEALRWAASNPSHVVLLAWKKFLRTWSLWPDGGEVGSTLSRMVITLGSFGILLLAVAASVLAIRPFSWSAAICWMPCLYFTLLHMVFVGSIRYREPGVFVLCALAGITLARVAGCYSHSPSPAQYNLSRSVQGSASVRSQSNEPGKE